MTSSSSSFFMYAEPNQFITCCGIGPLSSSFCGKAELEADQGLDPCQCNIHWNACIWHVQVCYELELLGTSIMINCLDLERREADPKYEENIGEKKRAD